MEAFPLHINFIEVDKAGSQSYAVRGTMKAPTLRCVLCRSLLLCEQTPHFGLIAAEPKPPLC